MLIKQTLPAPNIAANQSLDSKHYYSLNHALQSRQISITPTPAPNSSYQDLQNNREIAQSLGNISVPFTIKRSNSLEKDDKT